MYSGSKIRQNKAYDGAGVFNEYATFNLHGGDIQYNVATRNGGGIYIGGTDPIVCAQSIVNLYDSALGTMLGTIKYNTATLGGGIYKKTDSILSGSASQVTNNIPTQQIYTEP